MSRSKAFPIILMSTGLLILSLVAVPVLISTFKFHLFSQPDLIDPTAVSGLPAPQIVNVLGVATSDLTQADNWFSTSSLPSAPVSSKVKYFTISIPRLGILDVPVEVNGTDLKNNAIHFTGSAMPGSFGNAVVFGHSALPQFYTKDNPLTVFNPLVKAKIGDEITVKYDGISYLYVVKETREVTPDQISVLSQRFDRSELTVITCTPLGTYWRRFVARAELVS